MKYLKLFIVSFAVCLMFPYMSTAKSNNVTVIMTAQGSSEQEAKDAAFRMALEQVCGAIVSASSKIENDELVSDEIVTFTQGSISNYKVLNSVVNSDGTVYLTLSITIGVREFSDMLKKSKNGAVNSIDFDPSADRDIYLLNERMKAIQRENESRILEEMIDEVMVLSSQCYEKGGMEARQIFNNSKTRIKYTVSGKIVENDYLHQVDQLLASTLSELTKMNLDAIKQEDEGALFEAKRNARQYFGLTKKTSCKVYLQNANLHDVLQVVNYKLTRRLYQSFQLRDNGKVVKVHWTEPIRETSIPTGAEFSYELIEDIATSIKHNFELVDINNP